MQELPLPPHYAPDKVGHLWRVPYERRAAEAEQWARRHDLRPAAEDDFRVALVAVDVQNTFCLPDFELYVAGRSGSGAINDNRRLCQFIYRNLGSITQIFPTLDTHQAAQIFHALFLVNATGEHPSPMTIVTASDIVEGVWRFNADLAHSMGIDPAYAQEYLVHYTGTLAKRGAYDLTIWPYHAMLGSVGHALVPAFEEAIFFHGVARRSQPDFQVKGDEPLTEHYSAFGPEVKYDQNGFQVGAINDALLAKLATFDVVVIAGEAKSHCVAWTVQHYLDALMRTEPERIGRVYLLDDCTSPVVVPGVVDYADAADAAFARFAAAGMHVVRSTEPMENWLSAA